jgi:hypothetical protein
MSPNSPKTDEALQKAYQKLVDEIMGYFTSPMSWPLTNQDRVRFVRWVYSLAKEIDESEPYRRAKVMQAVEACRKHTESQKVADEDKADTVKILAAIKPKKRKKNE